MDDDYDNEIWEIALDEECDSESTFTKISKLIKQGRADERKKVYEEITKNPDYRTWSNIVAMNNEAYKKGQVDMHSKVCKLFERELEGNKDELSEWDIATCLRLASESLGNSENRPASVSSFNPKPENALDADFKCSAKGRMKESGLDKILKETKLKKVK